jgi:anthranilate phosphoribosyltransferase
VVDAEGAAVEVSQRAAMGSGGLELSQSRGGPADDLAAFVSRLHSEDVPEPEVVDFVAMAASRAVSVDEVVAVARVFRGSASWRVAGVDGLTDVCGTGGGKPTFNVSTAAALVVAAAGVPVAKHGCRAVTSSSGSTDVVEALGVRVDVGRDVIARLLRDVGVAFLDAASHYPVMRRLVAPASSLGSKGLFFGVIGPLINPVGASHHLLGVYDAELVELIAGAAGGLGFRCAIVVHGRDGFDEVSTVGATSVAEVRPGSVCRYEVTPEDFGMRRARPDDLVGGDPKRNAQIISALLAGTERGARLDLLRLNAGFALYAAGAVADPGDGVDLATEVIASGAARAKLLALVAASRTT